MTSNWKHVHDQAPELADLVRARFEATGLAFLATLRKDGSPRISGIEPLVGPERVLLGMMPQSLKALDLRRDPRCALHAASIDKAVTDGDARISGRAIEHLTDAEIDEGRRLFTQATGQAPPDGPMHLFSLDITEIMFLQPGDGHLVIRSWTPQRGQRRVERA
jgi:hypothetical protein